MKTTNDMTLRDYFAAKAMWTLMADTDVLSVFNNPSSGMTYGQAVAQAAYDMADAMLETRGK